MIPPVSLATPGKMFLCLVSLSACIFSSGCGEYNAVEEIGYDSPWYVTVVYDDGSRRRVMVENISGLIEQEASPKAVHVEGIDRRNQEKVLIDIEQAMQPNPASMQVANRYKSAEGEGLIESE